MSGLLETNLQTKESRRTFEGIAVGFFRERSWTMKPCIFERWPPIQEVCVYSEIIRNDSQVFVLGILIDLQGNKFVLRPRFARNSMGQQQAARHSLEEPKNCRF